jgi:hypothetical protein
MLIDCTLTLSNTNKKNETESILRDAKHHIMLHLVLGRAMVQVVSRQPLIAEVRIRFQVIPCKICGGQSGTETVLRLLRLSPVNIISLWLSIIIYHWGEE